MIVVAVLAALAGALQWSDGARAQAPEAREEYVRLVTGDLLLYRREPGGRSTNTTPRSPTTTGRRGTTRACGWSATGGEARVHHPRDTNGFAALRVRAEDTDGNAIEQTTLRAFQLR